MWIIYLDTPPFFFLMPSVTLPQSPMPRLATKKKDLAEVVEAMLANTNKQCRRWEIDIAVLQARKIWDLNSHLPCIDLEVLLPQHISLIPLQNDNHHSPRQSML